MDVTTANSVTSGQSSSSSYQSSISSDFTMFLKMLTTQMKHQDPLNPMDSSDFSMQLATFSGVEQQTRSNQLLEGLGKQLNLLGMAQLASWVGHEARYSGPVSWQGEPISLVLPTNLAATRSVLVARDSYGTPLVREELVRGESAREWLGRDMTGQPLPSGLYTLTVEHYQNDDLIGIQNVESYGRIIEAQNGSNGSQLVLAGNLKLDASSIAALRLARP